MRVNKQIVDKFKYIINKIDRGIIIIDPVRSILDLYEKATLCKDVKRKKGKKYIYNDWSFFIKRDEIINIEYKVYDK